MSENAAVSKVTVQIAEQSGVLAKLIAFSLTLAIAPLSSYFLSEKYLWEGNSTYAAITAIVAANVVLVAYIIVSVLEENKATNAPQTKVMDSESKKAR